MIKMIMPEELKTYWDKNPRNRNQIVIDGLATNMQAHGFNPEHPVIAFVYDGQYHLSDGHHRREGAIQAGVSKIPVELHKGDADAHLESLCMANLKFDLALGNVGQMFTPAEKRTAITQALTIPHIWWKSDKWLSKLWRTSHSAIANYRYQIVQKMLAPDNPLGLSQKRILELKEAILMGKRQSENGQWQPVKNCRVKSMVEATHVPRTLLSDIVEQPLTKPSKVVEKKTHFVYALNCGATDVDGHPCITFGHSTKEAWDGRLRNYKTCAAFDPDLLGVIECYGEKDARRTERTVLRYTKNQIPLEKARSEMRRVDVDLLLSIGKLFNAPNWLNTDWKFRKTDTNHVDTTRLNRDDILIFMKNCRRKFGRLCVTLPEEFIMIYRQLEDE